MMEEALRSRDIIQALRSGTVPSVGVRELAVISDRIVEELHESLDYIRQDRSDFKFIRGGYGAGKTFICSLFRQIALEENFCTSTVVVSPDLQLAQHNKIYAAIVNGIRTREKQDNCAFSDILDDWLWQFHKKIEKLEGVTYSDLRERKNLLNRVYEAIAAELGRLGTDPGFTSAIQSYYKNRAEQNPSLAQFAFSWLVGSSASITSQVKNKLGLKGDISPSMGFAFLRGILKLIKDLNYSGLVIVIDEVETILHLPSFKHRQEALETIRVIVDDAAQNAFPGCLFLIAGTDRFFLDDRYGLPSYEALKDRIDIPKLHIEKQSLRQPIYTVKPLQEKELLEVAEKVLKIHGIAYDWSADTRVTKDDIRKYANLMASKFGGSIEQIPRGFLRGFIHLCDLLQENESLSVEDIFGDPRSLTDQVHEVEAYGARV